MHLCGQQSVVDIKGRKMLNWNLKLGSRPLMQKCHTALSILFSAFKLAAISLTFTEMFLHFFICFEEFKNAWEVHICTDILYIRWRERL